MHRSRLSTGERASPVLTKQMRCLMTELQEPKWDAVDIAAGGGLGVGEGVAREDPGQWMREQPLNLGRVTSRERGEQGVQVG